MIRTGTGIRVAPKGKDQVFKLRLPLLCLHKAEERSKPFCKGREEYEMPGQQLCEDRLTTNSAEAKFDNSLFLSCRSMIQRANLPNDKN